MYLYFDSVLRDSNKCQVQWCKWMSLQVVDSAASESGDFIVTRLKCYSVHRFVEDKRRRRSQEGLSPDCPQLMIYL